MRIRLWGIILAAGAIASAGPLMALPAHAAAAKPAQATVAPTHPVSYVPIFGAKGTGYDRVFHTTWTSTADR
jgi:hypothetical protein